MTPETRILLGKIARCARSRDGLGLLPTPKPPPRAFAEEAGLKLGGVAQPLRVALTGKTTSPGIFDVLAVLGRQECLDRLKDQASV